MFSECYIFAFCVDYSCSNGCHYVLAVDSVGCLLFCASGTYDSHDTLPVTTWKSFCCAKVRPTYRCSSRSKMKFKTSACPSDKL